MTNDLPGTGDTGQLTLTGSRDALSSGHHDDETAEAIIDILAAAKRGELDDAAALVDLQGLLEKIRHTPEGAGRIARMNAFVRTLGRADNLAAFLELMRGSLNSEQSSAQAIAEESQTDASHCIYGWAGQTLIMASQKDAVASTVSADEDVVEFMGYEVAEWRAAVHIWQPNPEAEAFESTKRFEPDAISEPPHSHPFSFVSYVSKGRMRQSIYEEASAMDGDRYAGVDLERVDGVWPPHREYERRELRTVEERVLLEPGHSYFMSPDLIHDVEVDRRTAGDRPTITLFLCSETTRIPDSYLVPSMARFHRDNPELTDRATPLTPQEWDAKLQATARYLRGETEYLRLGELFECGSSYSFANS